jgi:serine/threonine protein kinase
MTADETGPARPLESTDPRRLGPYILLGLLGEGGMGRVYLGRDARGRRVAVKVVRRDLAADPSFLARFREEAQNAQRVARYSTAEVLDFDTSADLPYLVTEFVEGPTLGRRVRQAGPARGSELDQLALSIAYALEAVHRAALVHRDLKPENVILSPTGPRVIDFGIARALDSDVMRGRTRIGTLAYMAPEQILGQETTQKADIFAWGLTIAFAATGRYLFGADGYYAWSSEHPAAQPDLSGIELPLRSVIRRALLPAPADRPTAPELVRLMTGAGEPGRGPAGTADLTGDPIRPGSARAYEIEQMILRRLGY